MFGQERPRTVYLAAAVVLFGIEVLIALFVRDGFVRGYLGDTLAAILVYAGFRAATRMSAVTALMLTLVVAFGVEIAQAANMLGALGLSDNRVARIVLGGVFDPMDLAAYALGAALIVGVEMGMRRGR